VKPVLHGVMAEFATAEALVHAARYVRERGYSRVEAYTPVPVPELDDIILRRNWLPLIVLVAGALGTLTGYVLPTYIAVWNYPINVGGRPLHSWPPFVVIMFELTVLFAALGAFFGTLIVNGFPAPYHPLGNTPGFERASQDRFFLCIESRDPEFDRDGAAYVLSILKPERVEDVIG
jgi:hypothetical protein